MQADLVVDVTDVEAPALVPGMIPRNFLDPQNLLIGGGSGGGADRQAGGGVVEGDGQALGDGQGGDALGQGAGRDEA